MTILPLYPHGCQKSSEEKLLAISSCTTENDHQIAVMADEFGRAGFCIGKQLNKVAVDFDKEDIVQVVMATSEILGCMPGLLLVLINAVTSQVYGTVSLEGGAPHTKLFLGPVDILVAARQSIHIIFMDPPLRVEEK